MSNSVRRPPLRGVILQGHRPVGGLDLPEPPEPFILQFSRQYGSLGLSVVPIDQLDAVTKAAVCSATTGAATWAAQRPPQQRSA